jgi:hypothetical protein
MLGTALEILLHLRLMLESVMKLPSDLYDAHRTADESVSPLSVYQDLPLIRILVLLDFRRHLTANYRD